MTDLTQSQKKLHDRAILAGRNYWRSESQLIEVLQEVDRTKLHKRLGCSSLFVYVVKILKIDESVAYSLITVARKAAEIPALLLSIREQRLSVAKANRIVSTLTPQNADELICFAEKHTAVEINRKVATLRRQEGLPVKLRTVQVSDETLEMLKRARSLMSKGTDIDTALKTVLAEHLDRHDPVRKAKKAMKRKETQEKPKNAKVENFANSQLCTYRNSKRVALSAEQKHTVFARDGGQCTHRNASGERCGNDRFLHIHHIKPVSVGGTNDPENLTTLCSFHHDLAHQLALPIEGQITWLRERRFEYRA